MNKNNKIIILLHSLIWLVLFSLFYYFSPEKSFSKTLEHSWIPLFTYAFVFYLNYFYLINKFLFSKKWILFFAVNIVTAIILVEVRFESRHLFFSPEMHHMHGFPPPRPMSFMLFSDFFAYTIPIVFSIALKSYNKWLATEREKTEAVNTNLSSELEQLKYQLQPHFFFNSLNNIYSMVDFAPEKAKTMIHSLSKLMRYLLYEANVPRVYLMKEMEFINRYIDLMEVRFSENVTIERDFQEPDPSVQIPPLLFISIVENAFKHGVSATQPSHISFSLLINNNHIQFTVSNSSFPKSQTDNSGSGIGLENLQKRLELLYKKQYLLTIKDENGLFSVQLVLDKNVQLN